MQRLKQCSIPGHAGKEVKMFEDLYDLKYAKQRQKEFLDEAEARRLVKAVKAAKAKKGVSNFTPRGIDLLTQEGRTITEKPKGDQLKPRKGGFLGLLEWLFQSKGSAEAH
jgi:hypothetical protein